MLPPREASRPVEIDEAEALRAEAYGMLARLLIRPPDATLLDIVSGLRGDDSTVGQVVAELAGEARATTPAAASDEYHELFIGIARGELLPYASYYLTGFLHEKPLARLRADMARLGIERASGIAEPEDHIAGLCEMMAGLITGNFGAPADLAQQHGFFDRHVGCWAKRFFDDLSNARAARLYRPVGRFGSLFMTVESDAFAMAA